MSLCRRARGDPRVARRSERPAGHGADGETAADPAHPQRSNSTRSASTSRSPRGVPAVSLSSTVGWCRSFASAAWLASSIFDHASSPARARRAAARTRRPAASSWTAGRRSPALRRGPGPPPGIGPVPLRRSRGRPRPRPRAPPSPATLPRGARPSRGGSRPAASPPPARRCEAPRGRPRAADGRERGRGTRCDGPRTGACTSREEKHHRGLEAAAAPSCPVRPTRSPPAPPRRPGRRGIGRRCGWPR